MGHDAFTSEAVAVVFKRVVCQKDGNQGNWGMATTCTKFLYTKGLINVPVVCRSSLVMWNTVIHGAMQLISWTLLCRWMSSWCFLSRVHVTPGTFPPFLSKYHLFDVTLPILWYIYLNKEDIFVWSLFLPSLAYHPSSFFVFGAGGHQAAGSRV